MTYKENFINLFKNNITRKGSNELLEWIESTDFFEAPCSTVHHLCYEGGLVEHSIHVHNRLLKMAAEEQCNYTDETLAIVSLLHDLCKINFYKKYEKNVNVDGKWQKQECYTYTNEDANGHGEKSVISILKYMQLTDEEITAINWHMGGFDYRVKGGCYDMNNAYKRYKLAPMLHIADMQATYLDER